MAYNIPKGMDYNRSNNWAYEPKKFKDCKVGDEVYYLCNKRNYPTLRTFVIDAIEDVDLVHPTRHWKKFKIREVQSIYAVYPWMFKLYPYDEKHPHVFEKEIYGYNHRGWMEPWMTGKLYSDKKIAFHSLQHYLKQKIKQNTARLKKLQAALEYQQKMLDYTYTEVSPDELNKLNYKNNNGETETK
jgi:hypothetical protein